MVARSRLAFVVLLVAPLAALPLRGAEAWRPELLPRDVETRAALAAGPPHFAEEAGVYLLTATGYELSRPSKNGFHCLVTRSLPGAFEPQCFDAEGSATQLRETLLRARLQMQGLDEAAIDREIGAAWMAGQLRAPSRPGINYMLSPQNRVPVDAKGTIAPYRPHVMFYAPFLTNADLGGRPGAPGSPVFVINEGTPFAYAIVPVPDAPASHSDHP